MRRQQRGVQPNYPKSKPLDPKYVVPARKVKKLPIDPTPTKELPKRQTSKSVNYEEKRAPRLKKKKKKECRAAFNRAEETSSESCDSADDDGSNEEDLESEMSSCGEDGNDNDCSSSSSDDLFFPVEVKQKN